MKKMFLFFTIALITVFFTTSNSLADGLSSKEEEFLKQNVIFSEEDPITKMGSIKIYEEKVDDLSKLSMNINAFTGCIPIEISSKGIKKYRHIIFNFSIARRTSQDSPMDLIASFKKVMVFPVKNFNQCPSKDELNEAKAKREAGRKEEKKP